MTTTNENRRSFLKTASVALAGLGVSASLPVGSVFAQEGEKKTKRQKTIVAIYLRGGIDALNVVIPYTDPNYYKIRPTIGVKTKASEEDGPALLTLDKQWGLHPSFASLHDYFKKEECSFITCVGSPHRTRSHFDAQDFMEYAAPGNRNIRDGWLNRYLEETKGRKETDDVKQYDQKLRALAMQSLLPRSLRGEYPVLAVPDNDVLQNDEVIDLFKDIFGDGKDEEAKKKARETTGGMGDKSKDGKKSDDDDGMQQKMGDRDSMGGKEGNTGDPNEREDPVVETGRDTIKTLERFKEIIKREIKAERPEYPSGRLGQQLKAIATVLHTDEPLEVAAVDVGGWDTHANQGGAEGSFADRARNLSDSIAAFLKDCETFKDDVCVVVMTEFGRTCKENGNNGTDHGHGGVMIVAGGKVKGGEVHGEFGGLEEKNLWQGRDLQVTTDFRDVFYTVLRKHMRYRPGKEFFPDYEPNEVKKLF